MNAKPTTGVDKALSYEAVYYSAPMPRDAATLTILGAVFDKVYFPGVYLPKGGYDQAELNREIARIEGFGPSAGQGTDVLLAMLRFTRHAKVLEGFCEFTGDREHAFGGTAQISTEALEEFYFAVHGRGDLNWHPMFTTGHSKALPGGEEHIAYPGDYHYLFHAVAEANRRGITLLNDRPGAIPMVAAATASPRNDATALSTMLAIECAKLALPEMPILGPQELMDFRSDNVEALRAYRRAMLTYAGDLNGKLKDLTPADIEHQTQFFVRTEIVPALDALRASFNDPARPWHKRWLDTARVTAEVGAGLFTLSPAGALAVAVAKYSGLIAGELMAEGDHRTTMKRNGLYYLLRLEQAHQRK